MGWGAWIRNLFCIKELCILVFNKVAVRTTFIFQEPLVDLVNPLTKSSIHVAIGKAITKRIYRDVPAKGFFNFTHP